MEQLVWQTPEAARRGLADIEQRISGGVSFETYLAQLQRHGQAQCTTVWTRRTIAYRCRTCQVNDSSAICVNCFQAGDHRHHDFVMYFSDSGGSCDCGDPAAWTEEGFCSMHNRYQPHEESSVPPHLKEFTHQAVQYILRELTLWVERIVEAKGSDKPPPGLLHEMQMAQTYVTWLQKICSFTAIRTVLCEESVSVQPGRGTSSQQVNCMLDTLLLLYRKMPETLMEAVTTLLLRMLYDQHFKESFSRAFMRHYADLILPVASDPGLLRDYKILDQSLDRVMVQLFNVPETTLNLIQHDNLLEGVMHVWSSLMEFCTEQDASGIVNVNHIAIKEKVIMRPLGDLKLILVHDAVSLHLLKDKPDIYKAILSICSMLQWMNPYVQSEAVESVEQGAQGITLEMNTIGITFGLIQRCFSVFPSKGADAKAALMSAGCLTMHALRDFLANVSRRSQDGVSLHIPLHRTFSAIISKLVLMSGEEDRGGLVSALQPAFSESEILALMDYPLRVLVWMAQIRAQMWRNSSEDFSRLEYIYRGSIWHAQSMDMDILFLQFCSVARDDMAQPMVTSMAQRFELLDLVTAPQHAESLKKLVSLQKISMLHDFLRLISLVVRERRNAGMSEKESLRSDVIQWLCVQEHTYTELAFSLSGPYIEQSKLIDEHKLNDILKEVAIYHEPRLQERGYFQLKPECWTEFDPSFAHFYVKHLEEAQERAISVGKVPQYWRLKPPRPAKPPFDRLMSLLHTEACRQLIWNVLRSVTLLIRDEETATSAEALGVLALQLLRMILDDFRIGARSSHKSSMTFGSSLVESQDEKLKFLFVKPFVQQLGVPSDVDKHSVLSSFPSIYEMLCHLHHVKDSLRLVDLADNILGSLSPSFMAPGRTSLQPVQISDVSMDDEQRKLKKQRQDAILANFAARPMRSKGRKHSRKYRQKAFLENVGNDEDFNDTRNPASQAREEMMVRGDGAEGATASRMPSDDKRSIAISDQHECAFCRSELDGQSPTGWIAWVQRYNIPSLIHNRGQVMHSIEEAKNLVDAYKEEARSADVLSIVSGSPKETVAFGGLDIHPTDHVRCCGHQMHQACFQGYAESLIRRHYANSPYEGKGIIDLGNLDFLCPICRRLANVLLPDVNKVIPWKLVRSLSEHDNQAGRTGPLDQTEESVTPAEDDTFDSKGSSSLYDLEYWKQYWRAQESLAEAVVMFVSQCLRVRSAYLKEPPDLEGFSLCQVLWETFAENIIHCEVETRELPARNEGASSSGSSMSESTLVSIGDTAHWRALTELGKLAMLSNTIPCAAKLEKRLLLLQSIGHETITETWKDDPAMMVESSVTNDESLDVSSTKEKVTSNVMESIRKTGASEKNIAEPEGSRGSDVHPKEEDKELRPRPGETMRFLSNLGRRRVNQEKALEVADTSSIGWLWNESRSLGTEAVASSDPFELLIMLLATWQGWPTFKGILKMVRATYIYAAAQASLAFDKLNIVEADDRSSLGSLKIEMLQLACLPFLRRVALLLQIIVEENDQFQKCGQGFYSMDALRLQRWLNLPSVQDAAALGIEGKELINVQQLCMDKKLEPLLYQAPRRVLFTNLPAVFQELLLQNYGKACVNCRLQPRQPAICLICGHLLCCGTDCCNVEDKGECYRHADKESAGVGLFLLMRSTGLVLLRNNRVYVAPSLYLDIHGEECVPDKGHPWDLSHLRYMFVQEDVLLKRGHPLHLSQLRVNEIRRLWVTAAFDHDTHILHNSKSGGKIL